MKIKLKEPREWNTDGRWKFMPLKSIRPFVENKRAVLIHRPKTVQIIKFLNDRSYLSVKCYCGASFTGKKKFTFLDAPSVDSVLCHRCEENAVEIGLPSAETIVGNHVHIGGVKPYKICHPNED